MTEFQVNLDFELKKTCFCVLLKNLNEFMESARSSGWK